SNVAGDHRSSPGRGAIANRNRSDQHCIASDKNARADGRAVLVAPVEVAGDRPGANIDIGAHFSVTQIAKVVHLGPGTDVAVLHFGEAADLYLGIEHGAGPNPSIRTDRHALTDDGPLDHRPPDASPGPHSRVDDLGAGADIAAVLDDGAPAQVGVRPN